MVYSYNTWLLLLMDEYLDYYEQDDDSDDERHFRHLKKVNTGYDNETVKNIRLELFV